MEKDEDVRATIPRLLDWIQHAMDQSDGRAEHESALKAEVKARRRVKLAPVRGALIDVIAANQRRYASLRTFRNNLILVTGTLALLIAVMAGWHALNTNFLSLCTGGDEATCLSGAKPAGADVALVALMGAVGGLLAIAFALMETAIAPSRYDPKIWQALLKPITGATTALLGILLLQAEFVISPAPDSQSVFLAYAAVFGFSQQLFTRFVDKRAETLLTPEA
jgi:hypothetical protein